MAIKPHFLKTRRKKMRGISHNAVRPGRVILLGFLGIIVAGMLLLHLPIAARSRCCTPWVDCLFTSAAATCVTGLTVVDTWEHWSFFGRSVILLQVQIGGLGVMAVVAMMSFVARRTITMRERLEMSAELSMEDIAGVVRLTRNVLLFTLAAEGAGALIICAADGVSVSAALFESVAAFSTAGMSQGLTPTLGVISKLWLVLEMYLGRVGVLTLSVAVLRRHVAEPKITYPEGRIIVG